MSKGFDGQSESDWFRKHEKEMLERAAEERERRLREAVAKQQQDELDKLRTAHWLKCPKCGHDMEALSALLFVLGSVRIASVLVHQREPALKTRAHSEIS